jgi:virginiamycin A acetyltransferase
VVGSDVPPYSIVAGNPARIVRKRFDDELAALMLRWEWWDLPVETIRGIVPLLHSADLDSVKSKIRAMLGEGA